MRNFFDRNPLRFLLMRLLIAISSWLRFTSISMLFFFAVALHADVCIRLLARFRLSFYVLVAITNLHFHGRRLAVLRCKRPQTVATGLVQIHQLLTLGRVIRRTLPVTLLVFVVIRQVDELDFFVAMRHAIGGLTTTAVVLLLLM